jgi:thymidylate kinase
MIFITGAASAGKTSLIKLLKEQLPADKFDIHDIDEADGWTDDYEAWRDAKIEHWLKQSIKNKQKGIETILCGIIYPEHAEKCASYTQAQPVEYILLDADADTMRQRFYKRMESRINRQIEISKELKLELEAIDNKTVVDTTRLSVGDIAGVVASRLND